MENINEELKAKFGTTQSIAIGYIRTLDLAPVTQLRIGDFTIVMAAEDAKKMGDNLVVQSLYAIHMANGLKELETKEPKLESNEALLNEVAEHIAGCIPGAAGGEEYRAIAKDLFYLIDKHYSK